MLRAISGTTLNIDSSEYDINEVPDLLLTESELAQVREVVPGALQGYLVYVAPVEDHVLPAQDEPTLPPHD